MFNVFQLVPCLFLEIQHVHVVPCRIEIFVMRESRTEQTKVFLGAPGENVQLCGWCRMVCHVYLETRYVDAFGCIWYCTVYLASCKKNWGITIPASHHSPRRSLFHPIINSGQQSWKNNLQMVKDKDDYQRRTDRRWTRFDSPSTPIERLLSTRNLRDPSQYCKKASNQLSPILLP